MSAGVLSQHVLGLALIAWTTGLRHGLDADHITAIDNVVRRIMRVQDHMGVPQQEQDARESSTQRTPTPITVGTFFSLGHSTVVFGTIVAIAISVTPFIIVLG